MPIGGKGYSKHYEAPPGKAPQRTAKPGSARKEKRKVVRRGQPFHAKESLVSLSAR